MANRQATEKYARRVLDRPRPQRDQCETRRTAQISHDMPKVLPDAFEPWPDPHGSGVLPGSRDVAHGARIRTHLPVKLNLFGEVAFGLALAKEAAEPSQNPHGGPQEASVRRGAGRKGSTRTSSQFCGRSSKRTCSISPMAVIRCPG